MTGHLRTLIQQNSIVEARFAPPRELRDLPNAVKRLGGALDRGISHLDEDWSTFIARIDIEDPGRLSRKDQRKLSFEVWEHPELSEHIPRLLEFCSSRGRKTVDRRLARAYWALFDPENPLFADLAGYLSQHTDRLGSPWSGLCEALPLWDIEDGPAAFGQIIWESEDPRALLNELGLTSDDLFGGFAGAGFEAILRQISTDGGGALRAREADETSSRLLDLALQFPSHHTTAHAGLFAYAVLRPWQEQNPDPELRDRVIDQLLKEIGDPRTAVDRWAAYAEKLRKKYGFDDASQVLERLRRWLADKTVRLFFDLIARTTDRPDMWRDRRAFWEAYLNANFIDEAWFALGRDASRIARRAEELEDQSYGRVTGSGAAEGQSVLLMRMGDLVIAEWSDNGAARFWSKNPPKLYRRKYYGTDFRMGSGNPDVERIRHDPGWQNKFAEFISGKIGIRFPGRYRSGNWR